MSPGLRPVSVVVSVDASVVVSGGRNFGRISGPSEVLSGVPSAGRSSGRKAEPGLECAIGKLTAEVRTVLRTCTLFCSHYDMSGVVSWVVSEILNMFNISDTTPDADI
jgi:hypothetical protein